MRRYRKCGAQDIPHRQRIIGRLWDGNKSWSCDERTDEVKSERYLVLSTRMKRPSSQYRFCHSPRRSNNSQLYLLRHLLSPEHNPLSQSPNQASICVQVWDGHVRASYPSCSRALSSVVTRTVTSSRAPWYSRPRSLFGPRFHLAVLLRAGIHYPRS
jgi:hypothetical protein